MIDTTDDTINNFDDDKTALAEEANVAETTIEASTEQELEDADITEITAGDEALVAATEIENLIDEDDDNELEAPEAPVYVEPEFLAAEPTPKTTITPAAAPMPLKGQVEAALFLTNMPLQITDIAEKLNQPYEEIEEALLCLMDDYRFREESSLEIDDTDGYILQIKPDYRKVTETMLPIEISTAAIRTLSAIALKGPLLQSKLVEIRGSSAYDHIKELTRIGLVAKRKQQQSFILKVTDKFNHYFRIKGAELNRILMGDH